MDAAEQPAPARDHANFIWSRGVKFPRDPAIIQGKIRRLLRTNGYEAKEAEAALRVVRKDDVVVELGGGIGFMSTLVAKKRQVAAVHVFEANPNLIPFIQSVHQANDITNAHVTNAILGSRKGQVDFYIREPMLGSSLQRLDGEESPTCVKVDVLNAKQAFARIKPTILICDIEGAEVDLIPELDLTGLRGAVIETHPQWIGPEGMNKVMRAFMDAGLAYFHRGSQGKVLSFLREW